MDTTGHKLIFILIVCWALENSEQLKELDIHQWKWERTVPSLATNTNPGSQCRNHSEQFVRALYNYTTWAVAMQEASSLSLEGHLVGNTYHLGHFDECLRINVSTDSGQLQGKYCLAEVKFISGNSTKTLDQDHQTFWSTIQKSPDRRAFSRDAVYWAVCMPSSCTEHDLQNVLEHDLNSSYPGEGQVLVKIRPSLCQTEESTHYPWTSMDLLVSSAVGCGLLLVLVGSLYDFFSEKTQGIQPLASSLLLCFSAKQNLNFLSGGDLAGSGFDAIHGLRLLFMILAISGHRFMVSFGGPLLDDTVAVQGYSKPANMFIMNGMVVVDTFFVYSGTLTAYYLPVELDKKHFNPLLVWLYRFVRLTPVYLTVVAIHATLLIHLGRGPLWPATVGVEVARCTSNWWTNILYLNNYVNVDSMTWYLAVDTHLFMLSVLLVYTMWRWPGPGYILLAVCSAFSLLVPFLITYFNRADAFLLLFQEVVKDPIQSEYFQTMYAASHMRAGPYMVGVITGFLLYKTSDTELHIPKVWCYLAHLVSILLCVAAQFTGFVFYLPDHGYDPLESASYSSLHRTVWGAGIALNIFVLVRGKIDWLHNALTWPPLVPISRLTYCAYLVHTMSHLYEWGSLRTPVFPSYYVGNWMFIGDIAFTFSASLVLCLTVEAPFRAVEKLLFGRRRELTQEDHTNEAMILEEAIIEKKVEDFKDHFCGRKVSSAV